MKFLAKAEVNIMRDLQENIVSSKNQNTFDYYEFDKGEGIRVLYVGNSITKHAPKLDIGWEKDCGMAASCIEKDYVHLVQAKVKEYHPDAAFSILQVANYEREFYTREPENYYVGAKDFKPDIIFMFFGANVNGEYDKTENPPKTFGKAYEDLRNYLVDGRDVLVVHSQGFYIRPVLDSEKEAVAKKYCETFVNLDEMRVLPETHGMYNHPNDLGMQLIADKFWAEIEEYVKNFKK
ncbi:MAG: hypothetical protein U0M42_05290 [Acutalibacteraceae bacterium]|nr:hypothetical protein [Acutalibacteraceae bacterium]